MQISRKADYALRAATILAGLAPDRTMQAQELAEEGRIPIKFLEQILLVLKKAGILRSKRGVGGGYRLNRESRHISLAEIFEAVDGVNHVKVRGKTTTVEIDAMVTQH